MDSIDERLAIEAIRSLKARYFRCVDTLHGQGHYHETYRKIGGSWRIQTLKLTRLGVDTSGWETVSRSRRRRTVDPATLRSHGPMQQ